MEKHSVDMQGYIVVCELARSLVNHGWSMNIAPSQLRIGEKGSNSYVDSYRANKELVIPQIFSCKLRQWRSFAKVFFYGRFPIYGSLDNN